MELSPDCLKVVVKTRRAGIQHNEPLGISRQYLKFYSLDEDLHKSISKSPHNIRYPIFSYRAILNINPP